MQCTYVSKFYILYHQCVHFCVLGVHILKERQRWGQNGWVEPIAIADALCFNQQTISLKDKKNKNKLFHLSAAWLFRFSISFLFFTAGQTYIVCHHIAHYGAEGRFEQWVEQDLE